MEKTRMSTKGQVIVPKSVRDARGLKSGEEFFVLDTSQGILLKPVRLFPSSRLEDVFGCLPYAGKALTLEEMEAGIARGASERS